MTKHLTKSLYIRGLQCLKLLWYSVNDKSAFPPVDLKTQAKFDTGHLIGEYSKKLYPSGVEVRSYPPSENIRSTQSLLSKNSTLFEAGLEFSGCYARVDILRPAPDGAYDIIEVKSSTKAKEVYIQDVAFQKHVFSKAGVKVRNCYLMLVNNQYVRQGAIDPSKLLKLEDVSALVDSASEGIEQRIASMIAVMSASSCPDIAIGPQCTSPYDCDLMDGLCWKQVPSDSVFDLYNARGKDWELFNQGFVLMKDIPESVVLSDVQQVQRMAAIHCKPFVNHSKIKEFLSGLEYPLHFMDFESMNPAVPLFDGSRPYQQVPFQFSMHIQHQQGSPLEHHEFLHLKDTDPRPAFIRALHDTIQPQGSIIVFFQSFEKTRIKECAEMIPEYHDWYTGLLPRFVDLQQVFKQYWYYDPAQHGSNSIKAVLPALTGKGYKDLEIGDGMLAGLKYVDMMQGSLSAEEKEKIRKDLLTYCGLDTEGMVWLVEKLLNSG